MHFEAAGRLEVRGGCVLDRPFRPETGKRFLPDEEITRGISEELQVHWPAQCKIFDIPRSERALLGTF